MESLAAEEAGIAGTKRGIVLDIMAEGALVALADGTVLECDVMESALAAPDPIAPEDSVVVLRGGGAERPVLLGRIAKARRPVTAPDTLVLEARENLTLRCGDGSLTIRADGRILIKGRDLVSHARRMNRIRGGSVTIN